MQEICLPCYTWSLKSDDDDDDDDVVDHDDHDIMLTELI